jgi:3-oxoacyl-[acyl-carrier protein] reductase
MVRDASSVRLGDETAYLPMPAAGSSQAHRVVVVSGGSRGLGLEMVRHRVELGDRVATFSRSLSPELEELAADVGEEALFARALDATNYDAVASWVREVRDRFGRIDALVNNAAIGQDSLLAHTRPEHVSEMIRTNLEAPIVLTREVVRHMLVQSSVGHVVLVTSIAAHTGYAGLTVYSATKGGLEAFARALARELRGRVIVNCLAPGFFESDMSSVLGAEQLEAIVGRTPTGQLTTFDMLLGPLDLLLAPGTNVNGQTIVVDGGAAS